MLGAVDLEVGREVLVGVSPFVRSDDPDLLAAQPLAQRLKDARLVDAAHDSVAATRVGLGQQLGPVGVDRAVQDDVLAERVVGAAVVGVADDQTEGVDHGLMRGVVGSELEHAEQADQAAAVVVGVGRLEDLALLALVLRAGRAVLVDQVGQRRFAADDGIDHLTHAVVRRLERRFGDLAQHRVLAADAAEVFDELRDDFLLGVCVDAVDR